MNIYSAALSMIHAHNDLQDTIYNMWSTTNFNLAIHGIITWKEYWKREEDLLNQKKYVGMSDIIKTPTPDEHKEMLKVI